MVMRFLSEGTSIGARWCRRATSARRNHWSLAEQSNIGFYSERTLPRVTETTRSAKENIAYEGKVRQGDSQKRTESRPDYSVQSALCLLPGSLPAKRFNLRSPAHPHQENSRGRPSRVCRDRPVPFQERHAGRRGGHRP